MNDSLMHEGQKVSSSAGSITDNNRNGRIVSHVLKNCSDGVRASLDDQADNGSAAVSTCGRIEKENVNFEPTTEKLKPLSNGRGQRFFFQNS